MNLINQFAFYLFSLTSHRAINKKWKWNSPQRVKRCRFSRTFWVAAASRLLTLPRQQHPMMQTPHFALSKMIIRKASQSLRWNYHSFAPSIFTIHHQVHDRQPQLSHTFSTTKKCAYIGCSVLSSSWSRWQVALVVATHSPRLIALLQRLMAFSCHPHPQRQRQFRKHPPPNIAFVAAMVLPNMVALECIGRDWGCAESLLSAIKQLPWIASASCWE